MDPEGHVALVTGGANGLGRATAIRLAECGASVFALDRDERALETLPHSVRGLTVNLRDPSDVQLAVSHVIDESGAIDVLVNNAGVIMSAPMVNLLNAKQLMHGFDDFRNCVEDNLFTTFIATSAVVEQMVRRRTKGVVINISSISAKGNAGQTAYSAAKAGINAMTVVWAKEWGRLGIRCNAVAPGFIDSDSMRNALSESAVTTLVGQTPVGRLGDQVEVANSVEFLIRNDFVNGAILEIDGGLVL